jgi:hypothetical protein
MTWPSFSATQKIAVALIAVIVVLGTVLRADVIGGNKHLSIDERAYVANANRILAVKRPATFEWPPGTSFAFALASGVSGHRVLRLARNASGPAQYAQLAAGVLTLPLIGWLAWLAAGPWAAVLAVALGSSYLPLIDATRTFLSEPLGALALLMSVAAAAVAHARLQTRRWPLAVASAGIVGGLGCLTRADMAVGMGVIAVALSVSGRPGWRQGLLRGGIYLSALLLTLTPWLVYASATEGRFVPITAAGSHAFFIGTYLPGNGRLLQTEQSLAPEVCRHFPADCGRYWEKSAAPLFRLLAARHPDESAEAAVVQADLDNVRRYALGQPLAFTGMLWHKFWKMWTEAWSGGNVSRGGRGGGASQPSTSQLQHTIYTLLAWVGLLAGALATRRWGLIVAAATLVAIAGLATLFDDQPRYNVSLMPLLFAYGSAGAWLLWRSAWGRFRKPNATGASDVTAAHQP